jgi:hypothetical protein
MGIPADPSRRLVAVCIDEAFADPADSGFLPWDRPMTKRSRHAW